MVRMRSILSVLVVLISLTSVLKAEDEKVLRIGIGQEFDSLNPLSTSMLSALYIYNMVDRNVLSLNHEMKFEPQLVDEIPSLKKQIGRSENY
jgi:hypothetical protein